MTKCDGHCLINKTRKSLTGFCQCGKTVYLRFLPDLRVDGSHIVCIFLPKTWEETLWRLRLRFSWNLWHSKYRIKESKGIRNKIRVTWLVHSLTGIFNDKFQLVNETLLFVLLLKWSCRIENKFSTDIQTRFCLMWRRIKFCPFWGCLGTSQLCSAS